MSQRENFILILPNWLSCEDDFGSISFILLVRFVHLISLWYEKIISYSLSAAKLSIFLYYNLNFPLHIYTMKYADLLSLCRTLNCYHLVSHVLLKSISLQSRVCLFGTFQLTWDDLFADDGARPCDTSCCDKGSGGKGTPTQKSSTTNGASGASSQKLWYFLYVVCGIVGLL